MLDNEKANQKFTESYKGMTNEVNRVSKEKVTIWARLTSWIYSIIHRDPRRVKDLQNNEEKYKSAQAFDAVQRIFSKEKSQSMDNQQIMFHTQKRFSNEYRK